MLPPEQQVEKLKVRTSVTMLLKQGIEMSRRKLGLLRGSDRLQWAPQEVKWMAD